MRIRRLLRRIVVFSTSFVLGLAFYRLLKHRYFSASSKSTSASDLQVVLENAVAAALLHERENFKNEITPVLLGEDSSSLRVLKSLQDSLICAIGRRSLTIKPSTVSKSKSFLLSRILFRSSPKPKMYRDESCFPFSIHQTPSLCSLLSGKNMLFVGPSPTFHLHSYILDVTTNGSQAQHCPGPEFCTFHHICQLHSTDPTLESERFKQLPRVRDLIETKSSILRYILSSTLYSSPDAADARYVLPYVDPSTGVRVKDGYWIRRARKADVIVLNRGAVPAPASTYENGNWSFADRLPIVYHARAETKQAHRIITAAVHVTLETFLPEVLQTLRMLRTDQRIRRFEKRIIWHGSTLDVGTGGVDDPWALFYNAQILLQNALMPNLLPHFGIVFLPISIPTTTLEENRGNRKTARRSPRPTPEEAEVFLSGLEKTLHRLADISIE